MKKIKKYFVLTILLMTVLCSCSKVETNNNTPIIQKTEKDGHTHKIGKVLVLTSKLNRLGECSVCHKTAFSHREKDGEWENWNWNSVAWEDFFRRR